MKILRKTKPYWLLLSWPSFTKLASSILWSFGILLSVVVGIDLFFNTWAQNHIMPLWWGFLIIGVIIAICRNIPKTSYVCKINETDIPIEIRIGDIFETKQTIIVSANTTFDITMEDGVINPKSIQGVFTDKYCASVSELDQKLSNCLQSITPKQLTNEEKPYGKKGLYPIGTVAKINCRLRMAYFVAIAHMNKTKNAQSSRQNVLDAMPILWEFIRTDGELENICMPIIGSGFSRTKVTKQSFAQEILRSFVAACSEGKFCEKLTLFVHPDDIKKGNIDFDKIADFLKYICTYENKRIDSQSIETSRSEIADNNQYNKHIKAICFLLEDDRTPSNTRREFKTIIGNVAGTIQMAIPVLLEVRNFKEFIEKCNKSLTIIEDLEFNPQEQIKNPQLKQFSRGCLPSDYTKIKQWALDFDNNVYLNENAKNLFNEEFVKLKVSIEQV